jgi:TPP-dependent 2-oxoacid decarboxylase
MKIKHLISYVFFMISLVLICLIGYKHLNETKKIDHKYLIDEVKDQRSEIKEMSDQVIKMTNDLKNKRTDTIQIIKNKNNIIVKLEEKQLVLKDTIFQYITTTDTITEFIAKIDTVYIKRQEELITTQKDEKKRFWKKY